MAQSDTTVAPHPPATPSGYRILDLLPELRNQIYELALIEPTGTINLNEYPSLLHTQIPSLLQSCHQIRSEASSIYHGSHSFRFNIVHCTSCSRSFGLRAWLLMIAIPDLKIIPAVEVISHRGSRPRHDSLLGHELTDSKAERKLFLHDWRPILETIKGLGLPVDRWSWEIRGVMPSKKVLRVHYLQSTLERAGFEVDAVNMVW